MYDYYVNTELARLTIIIGILIATLVYKQTGMTLGGVIVPGYLALFLRYPLNILVTLTAASLAFLVVHYILKKRFLMDGRQLFEVEVLVALVFQVIWNTIFGYFGRAEPDWLPIFGIGFVLPGVIAHEMGRSGWTRTLVTALLGAILVYVIIVPLASIQELLANYVSSTSYTPLLRTQPYPYAFPLALLPFGLVVSILIDLLLYRWVKLRAGGYVTAAYLAMFFLRPVDIFFVLFCSLLTYIFISRIVGNSILAFGRTRLGITILAGVVISWIAEILVINLSRGTFVPWSGFVIIMPMIVSLLAADFERQGILRTLGAVSISSVGVGVVMQGVVLAIVQLNLNWLLIV
jgi:poly-gamma-glutamate biosynthesis protein PgsC/CapC